MGNIINCHKKPIDENENPIIYEIKNEIEEQNGITEEIVNKVISELEQDGYKKINVLNQKFFTSTVEDLSKEPTDKNMYADGLLSIMKNGTEEFEKKTGRKMTYSEMRATYG